MKEGEIFDIEWIEYLEHYIDSAYIVARLKPLDRGTFRQFGMKPVFCGLPLLEDNLSSLRGLLAGGHVKEKFKKPNRKVGEDV